MDVESVKQWMSEEVEVWRHPVRAYVDIVVITFACVAFKTYDFVACRGHTLVQLMIAIPAIEERTTWLSICIFFSTKKTVAMKFLFKVTCMTRIGCGMVFRFASKLQKHEKSHSELLCFWISFFSSYCRWSSTLFLEGKKKNYLSKFLKFYLLLTLTNVVKLDSVEALCCGPGCMNNIANDQYLEAHIQSSHQLGTCEICWTKRHLWKNEMPLWVFSSHFFFFFLLRNAHFQLKDNALLRIFIE